MEAKEQIRNQLDITDIIGETVVLKPAGRGRFKGLCPFHGEKTPSFHVSADKGFYYCFGCHAKGDMFDFVMQTQALSFQDALLLLGARAGVEVKPQGPQEPKKRDLYDLHKLALIYFRQQLEHPPNHHAKDYLLKRGLSPESLESFELGYAPQAWDGFLRHASAQGIAQEDLLRAGLIQESERGRPYDRFRHRVMFPIKDSLGRVIAFSGRVLDDSLPKYMNSPESEIFKKGDVLYGFDKAKRAIRESGSAIIVEGYMDVIALHQTHFYHSVAVLGANVTKEQAEQLARLEVSQLYLAFDADEAGQRAILSGLEQSVGRQFLVKAVRIPHGKDPADVLLSGDTDGFRRALNEGLSEVEFRFKAVLGKYDPSDIEGKKAILYELLPSLKARSLFDPVANELKRLVSEKLQIEPKRLEEWLSSKNPHRLNTTQVKGMQKAAAPSQASLLELEIIVLSMLESKRLKERVIQLEASISLHASEDSLLIEFCRLCYEKRFEERKILRYYHEREEGQFLFQRLFSLPTEMNDELQDSHKSNPHGIDIEEHFAKSLSRLREFYIEKDKEVQRQKLIERQSQLASALVNPSLSSAELQAYYAELKEIQVALNAREAERRMRLPAHHLRKKS
ncbi:MAG: DNA primase [Deinococcales bacterium]